MATVDANSMRAVAPVEMSVLARIYPALPALPVSLTPFLGRDTKRPEILALLRAG